MPSSKDKIFAPIFLILGAVLYFIPGRIAPVCAPMADGGFMKCHWTGEVVRALGILIVIIAVVMLLNTFTLKKEGVGLGLSIANIAVGVFTVLVPLKIIGSCPKPMMQCNVVSKPAILLVGGIFIVANIIYLFLNKKK